MIAGRTQPGNVATMALVRPESIILVWPVTEFG